MRYLAIILLSLTALLGAAGTSASADDVVSRAAIAPAAIHLLTHADVARGQQADANSYDGALATLLGGALVALQLRRRQKSLRMPRAFYG